MIITKFILVILIGYLLGSIPWGVIIGRRFAKVDVREYGSGKMGATNVMRVAGKKAAILVGAMDLSKGAIAVVIAGLLIGREYMVVGNFAVGMLMAQVLAALAAVAGHCWPVFLKFKGGRGVATFIGGMAALCPLAAIFGGEILLIGAGITQFVSLGSIAGAIGTYAILIPLYFFDGFPFEYLIYALIGTLILIIMHRDNIVRLVSGTERKIGQKAEAFRQQTSSASRKAAAPGHHD